jgi:hypothetical protein
MLWRNVIDLTSENAGENKYSDYTKGNLIKVEDNLPTSSMFNSSNNLPTSSMFNSSNNLPTSSMFNSSNCFEEDFMHITCPNISFKAKKVYNTIIII